MTQYDVIVIGAGISGLSIANYSAAVGLNTLVLERSPRAGGCFHSHRFEGAAQGFWLELGAHTCYNSYGGLIGLMEQHGLLQSILPRQKVSFKMLAGTKLASIGSQLSYLELLSSAWQLFTLKKEGESVSSYYGRIVGRKNYDRVFGPAFNAVISQRADDFPANMLFNKRPRRKDVIKSYTLKGGLQTITDTLAKAERVTLKTDAQVTEIVRHATRYEVHLADGTSFEAGALVIATPPQEGAELVRTALPEAAAVLAQIKVETIETLGVAVEKSRLQVPQMAGIIAANDTFYSAVSRDTVPDQSYRGFSFHFKAGRTTTDEKLARISQVLGVRRDDLLQVVQRESRLPSPVVGHQNLTAELDRVIAGTGLYVTGNYFAGMAIEDCIVRSRSEADRLASA